MISFPYTVKVYACIEPIDMRKSFDGLCGCVEQYIGEDPLSGHLFAFFNKRSTMVKILFWDRSGFCIWYKRLEQGRFNTASLRHTDVKTPIEFADLMLILEGIDLAGARRRKRYKISA